MAKKISVYVSEEMHRTIKAAASLRGKSLSEFMVDAAMSALHSPDRKAASAGMDQIRASLKIRVSPQEIQQMREEGRRF
jgi:hypothetical protein